MSVNKICASKVLHVQSTASYLVAIYLDQSLDAYSKHLTKTDYIQQLQFYHVCIREG